MGVGKAQCHEKCSIDRKTCLLSINLDKCTCNGIHIKLAETAKYDFVSRQTIQNRGHELYGEGYFKKCETGLINGQFFRENSEVTIKQKLIYHCNNLRLNVFSHGLNIKYVNFNYTLEIFSSWLIISCLLELSDFFNKSKIFSVKLIAETLIIIKTDPVIKGCVISIQNFAID